MKRGKKSFEVRTNGKEERERRALAGQGKLGEKETPGRGKHPARKLASSFEQNIRPPRFKKKKKKLPILLAQPPTSSLPSLSPALFRLMRIKR